VRRFAIFIVMLAVVWAIPGFRGRVGAAALPALEKLGPAGAAVAAPLRRTVAKMRTTAILRAMASDYNEGRGVPEERDFPRWIRTRFPDDNHLDPWGNPYWFQRSPRTLVVGSSGPDGRRNTADDVKHSIPF
jgi:hypothetical protein